MSVHGSDLSLLDRVRVVQTNMSCGLEGSSENTDVLRGTLHDNSNTAGTMLVPGTEIQWSGLVLIRAGDFRVCYCRLQGDDCDVPEDFAFNLGTFVSFGPLPVNSIRCVAIRLLLTFEEDTRATATVFGSEPS